MTQNEQGKIENPGETPLMEQEVTQDVMTQDGPGKIGNTGDTSLKEQDDIDTQDDAAESTYNDQNSQSQWILVQKLKRKKPNKKYDVMHSAKEGKKQRNSSKRKNDLIMKEIFKFCEKEGSINLGKKYKTDSSDEIAVTNVLDS